MNIEDILTSAIVKSIYSIYNTNLEKEQVQIQKTRPEFEGSFTLVVFPYLRISHKKPEETAQEIGDWLVKNE